MTTTKTFFAEHQTGWRIHESGTPVAELQFIKYLGQKAYAFKMIPLRSELEVKESLARLGDMRREPGAFEFIGTTGNGRVPDDEFTAYLDKEGRIVITDFRLPTEPDKPKIIDRIAVGLHLLFGGRFGATRHRRK